MICPNCGAQLPDTATICFSCRKQFKNNPESNTGELKKVQKQAQPQKRSQINMQKIAADREISNLKSDTWINVVFIVVVSILGLIFFLYIEESGRWIFATIALIIVVYNFISLANKKERIKELSLISNGRKRINLCPNCKSSRIEMAVVQSGSVSAHGTTTVSENINPLRPFTHTNVNQGNTYTVNAYGNKCHCLDCGAVFNEPEVYYQ